MHYFIISHGAIPSPMGPGEATLRPARKHVCVAGDRERCTESSETDTNAGLWGESWVVRSDLLLILERLNISVMFHITDL